ncbi:hypothetical protein LEP1GSC024_4562 [Leptospira noguchii str. 2001034031]|uniref:Uncharacterized protein n=1 Tax=Leptospira noguchii str. 2001034031 TaxID=1193053 RepID=M6YVI2_9LEPT|nr:hypothetical protein LEP1GSC024_4562 [Leptospira noguchii str. 2001034031]
MISKMWELSQFRMAKELFKDVYFILRDLICGNSHKSRFYEQILKL